MRRLACGLCAWAALLAACGAQPTGTTQATPRASTTTVQPTTTTVPRPTTTRAVTTTTIALLEWDGPECGVLQAAFWFASDSGSVSAIEEHPTALTRLYADLDAIGANSDELSDQRGVSAISNWLIAQLDGTPLEYREGDLDVVSLLQCLDVPGEEGIVISVDLTEDPSAAFSQIYAGRFDLPGAGRLTGNRETPIALGESERVGDWTIRVLGVDFDAAGEVAAENQFNDPPGIGNNFVLITLEAEYVGEESDTFWPSISAKALGQSNVTFEDSCGVIPDDMDREGEVFQGGVVTGNVCLEVAESDLESIVLLLEPWLSFDDATRVFFALR